MQLITLLWQLHVIFSGCHHACSFSPPYVHSVAVFILAPGRTHADRDRPPSVAVKARLPTKSLFLIIMCLWVQQRLIMQVRNVDITIIGRDYAKTLIQFT